MFQHFEPLKQVELNAVKKQPSIHPLHFPVRIAGFFICKIGDFVVYNRFTTTNCEVYFVSWRA